MAKVIKISDLTAIRL